VKLERFKYALKRSTGGKSMGRGRKGRAWRAVMKVARSIGGNGELPQSVAYEITVLLASWTSLSSDDMI